MIICPNCKEEIDDLSMFCDQCGQALRYCNRCGRVGLGRRCTNCGGMMVSAEEIQSNALNSTSFSQSISMTPANFDAPQGNQGRPNIIVSNPTTVPALTLLNSSLGIRIDGINGAVIGRKQGPYMQLFHDNMYVSGVHAQLRYNSASGWNIADKHSSNGTRLNGRQLQPDVDMSLKDGDVVTIANINLQVMIKTE